jgi:hypothetical protein
MNVVMRRTDGVARTTMAGRSLGRFTNCLSGSSLAHGESQLEGPNESSSWRIGNGTVEVEPRLWQDWPHAGEVNG